jgi:copper chaperone CopZ
MREVNLRIEGMHCGSCIRRVTQSLQSVAGAEVEEVRLGAARIQLPEGTDAESLVTGLGRAGFKALEEK